MLINEVRWPWVARKQAADHEACRREYNTLKKLGLDPFMPPAELKLQQLVLRLLSVLCEQKHVDRPWIVCITAHVELAEAIEQLTAATLVTHFDKWVMRRSLPSLLDAMSSYFAREDFDEWQQRMSSSLPIILSNVLNPLSPQAPLHRLVELFSIRAKARLPMLLTGTVFMSQRNTDSSVVRQQCAASMGSNVADLLWDNANFILVADGKKNQGKMERIVI